MQLEDPGDWHGVYTKYQYLCVKAERAMIYHGHYRAVWAFEEARSRAVLNERASPIVSYPKLRGVSSPLPDPPSTAPSFFRPASDRAAMQAVCDITELIHSRNRCIGKLSLFFWNVGRGQLDTAMAQQLQVRVSRFL